MPFHSATLLALVGVLALGYWLAPWQRVRLVLLLVASLFIYAWRHPPSLLLLLASIVFNYGWGLVLERHPQRRLLAFGIGLNLSSLLWFKYSAFIAAQLPLGVPPPSPWMPLGISFFTFQVIAYLVDVYRKEIPAERSLLVFAVFKSFFAQLVAGPIVRGKDLLPQLKEKRTLDFGDLHSGIVLVLAGVFLKVGIANLLAQHVEHAWADLNGLATNAAWFAVYGYAAQLLADFCGYSTMAVGFGLLFGLKLPPNFLHPYGAPTLREFWQRWHVTLSAWLRDYLYIPLGGNKRHAGLNRLVTMTLGGLWHGAGWTFVLWGFLHGVWLSLERLVFAARTPADAGSSRLVFAARTPADAGSSRLVFAARTPADAGSSRLPHALGVFVTFHVVALLWVPFRAPDLHAAAAFATRLFAPPYTWQTNVATQFLVVTFAFLALQGAWFRAFPLERREPARWELPAAAAMVIWLLGYGSARLDFIYFVF